MSSWKEKEDEARRLHILDVAEKLFAEKGLNETSIADIAKEAEFGVGTLYKYFPDRTNLVESLISDRMLAHLAELETAILTDASPRDRIVALVEAYLRSVNSRARFFRIYYTNFHPALTRCCTEKQFADALEQRTVSLFSHIDEIFIQGIRNGVFTYPGEPAHLTVAIFGILMSFYFFAEFRCDGKIDETGFKKAILQIFFEQTLNTVNEGN